MSIISPFPQNTQIYLYAGVPWGNDYSDIRLFETYAERTQYLETKQVAGFPTCSIVHNGRIRVTGQINDMINCNYMSFKNFGAGYPENLRTFYCFITSVDYVNINTVEIQYEIDWIQSYLFDFKYGECFVEREHVNDDTFGKHLLDEGIAITDYRIMEMFQHNYQKGYVCYYLSDVASAVNVDTRNGMLIATELTMNRYLVRGDLELFLNQLNRNGESDKVVSLTMCPMPFADQEDITNPNLQMFFNLVNEPLLFKDSESEYKAVNNKMGIFPFKLFTVDNYNGSVQEFHWENFEGDPAFEMDGVIHPRPCLECFPKNYLKWYGENFKTRNFAVQYTNFPQIPWTSDTFRAWVSQNGTAMFWDNASKGVQAVGGALTAALGIATGNPLMAMGGASGVMSGVAGISNNDNAVNYHATHGSQLGGALEACGMDYLFNTIGFRVIEYCLPPEVAKRIDKFFSRYGYKVDVPKKPNVKGRKYCNYVKCNQAHVDGLIPVDAKNAMERALLSGTTFWHTNNMDMDVTVNPIVRV